MRTYHKKFLEDGSPNPAYKPRNPNWKRQPKGKNCKGGKHRPQFLTSKFIAIDGEGGEVDGVHQYQLLAASDGSQIYKYSGLSSKSCLDYLWKLKTRNPRATFVIFAGGYDGNMWLRGTSKVLCQAIKDAEGQSYVRIGNYDIAFIQRKYFTLRHKDALPKEKAAIIWDVHGFFQGGFIGVCKQWIPDFPDMQLIIDGKKARVDFKGTDLDFMIAYNAAENRALVEIMNKFREALHDMGLTLRRFDGAGAVAAAMYKVNQVTNYYPGKHEPALPDEVEQSARHAYFGGRIEIGKYGRHNGKIYHYDINSAYPAQQRHLPALRGGDWKHIKINKRNELKYRNMIEDDEMQTLSCIKVQWDYMHDIPFCPFPFRSELQNKVLFPPCGTNWLWAPEIRAALREHKKYPHWKIEILEIWEFTPSTSHLPFAWIGDYYKKRQEIVAESKRTGIPNGQEKVIKLGLNSLYGKTAQRIGHRVDEKTGMTIRPPFHNLAYAGYITSAARAMLWRAAMQAPNDIICLATDGIYSTSPLHLYCPKEKKLGAWEFNEHDGMTLVQSGFYFLNDGNQIHSFSRGFDKMQKPADIKHNHELIMAAWKNGRHEIYLPCTRFITLKSALISDKWFSRWCSWHKTIREDGTQGRRLAITPIGTKRRLIDDKTHAHKYLVSTMPEDNFGGADYMSAQHIIPWDLNEDDEDAIMNLEHTIDSQH